MSVMTVQFDKDEVKGAWYPTKAGVDSEPTVGESSFLGSGLENREGTVKTAKLSRTILIGEQEKIAVVFPSEKNTKALSSKEILTSSCVMGTKLRSVLGEGGGSAFDDRLDLAVLLRSLARELSVQEQIDKVVFASASGAKINGRLRPAANLAVLSAVGCDSILILQSDDEAIQRHEVSPAFISSSSLSVSKQEMSNPRIVEFSIRREEWIKVENDRPTHWCVALQHLGGKATGFEIKYLLEDGEANYKEVNINVPEAFLSVAEEYLVRIHKAVDGDYLLRASDGLRPVALSIEGRTSEGAPMLTLLDSTTYRLTLSENHERECRERRAIRELIQNALYIWKSPSPGKECKLVKL